MSKEMTHYWVTTFWIGWVGAASRRWWLFPVKQKINFQLKMLNRSISKAILAISLFGARLTRTQLSFDAVLLFEQLHFAHTLGQGIISVNCQVFGVGFGWRWPRRFAQCKRFFDLRNLWKCGSVTTSWQRHTYLSGLSFIGDRWRWRCWLLIIVQIRRWCPWNWPSSPRRC